MRSYFKSIAKSIYEKTVEDEYLEPVTETEVYSIINRKRTNSIKLTHPNHDHHDPNQNEFVLQNIDRIALINPERQFKLIGNQYTYEVINIRVKELRIKSDQIRDYMLNNYDKSLHCIQSALVNLEDAKNIQKTKNKSANLRKKILALQKTVEKTSKITKINIKLNNIKNLIKICQSIPNIKKMTVFELKNINLQQVSEFKQTVMKKYGQEKGKMLCIEHLEGYIDKVGSEQLRIVIGQIGNCILKFDSAVYQKVLKDFVVTKSKIKYQKLLLRLLQTQIRDKQNQVQQGSNVNQLYLTCERYIVVLINMSKIFRWHRQNLAIIDVSPQIQESIRVRKESQISNCSQTSDDKYPIINLDLEDSIKINTKQMRMHVCELMDQCVKQNISQKLFALNISHQQILEYLCLLNRFMQVGYCFSAYYFKESKQQAIQILQRKCYKLQEKGIRQFNETLAMEEGNQWNRLPVMNNFRHRGIDKTLFKFRKVVNSENFRKIKESGYRYLNISEELIQQDKIQQVKNKHETYELKLFKVGSYQKIQKSYNIDLKQLKIQEHLDSEVVICQSSITILNYFDNFLNIYFHVPIMSIRSNILDKMFFFVEYYIYYIFQTFLSQNFKNVCFQSFKTTQQNYLQKRIRTLYKNLYNLISNFSLGCQSIENIRQQSNNNNTLHVNGNDQNRRRKKSIQTSKLKNLGFFWTKPQIRQTKIAPQNAIKSRVISSESVKFILNYFEHIINSIKSNDLNIIQSQANLNEKNQSKQLDFCLKKINDFRKIQEELADLLLTDIVPKNMNITFVDQILKKIRWHQPQNWSQINDYGQLILKTIKGTHQKIKGISKGEIPYQIRDVIFSIYWKSQLTYMVREFLAEHIETKQKGNATSKLSFQKLIDLLYEGVVQYLRQKYKSSQKQQNQTQFQLRISMINNSYEKIKSIFPILLQTEWEQCQKKLQKSIRSHEFIYKISINLMKASQSCARLSSAQVQDRRVELNQFIDSQVLKQQQFDKFNQKI